MGELSQAQRNKLARFIRRKLIVRRFRQRLSRMIFNAFMDLNKIANRSVNKNPDAAMEVYNHSVLKAIDKLNRNDGFKKLAIFFIFKMNQRERNKALTELEKEAVIEEAEELVRDKS